MTSSRGLRGKMEFVCSCVFKSVYLQSFRVQARNYKTSLCYFQVFTVVHTWDMYPCGGAFEHPRSYRTSTYMYICTCTLCSESPTRSLIRVAGCDFTNGFHCLSHVRIPNSTEHIERYCRHRKQNGSVLFIL